MIVAVEPPVFGLEDHIPETPSRDGAQQTPLCLHQLAMQSKHFWIVTRYEGALLVLWTNARSHFRSPKPCRSGEWRPHLRQL